MCISAEASRNMFLGGVVSSVLLMKFGLKKLEKYNLFLVITFLYVTLMQIIDYLIWTDLDCKNGRNKLAGITGPLLNYSQPLLVLLIGYLLFSKRINKEIVVLNVVYTILFLVFLYTYYTKGKYCSKVDTETGNLIWIWTKDKFMIIMIIAYIVTLFTNLLSFSDNYYMMLVHGFIFGYLLLVVFNIKNYNSIGNLWCFIAPTIILLFLIFQHLYPKSLINKIDKKYLRNILSM